MSKISTVAIALLVSSLFIRAESYDSNIFLDINYKDSRSISKWFKRKPDFNVINEQGQSVLIKAVQSGNRILVRRLLNKGVDVNIIDDFGKTALDYAIEKNYQQIVLMLVEKKAMVTSQQNIVDVRQMITSNARWLSFWGNILLFPVKVLLTAAIIALPIVVLAMPYVPVIAGFAVGMGGAAEVGISSWTVAMITAGVSTSCVVVGLPCYTASIGWYDKQAWYTPSLITYNTAVIR